MGRGLELTFSQSYRNGQQAHEKMLNITNHQGNANQNHNEILPHTGQNDHHQKKSTNNKCWMDAEEKEPSSSVGGDVNWCSDYAEQCGGSSENCK